MDRKDETPHYHIHWSRVLPLNWERFSTRADAEASAELFVLQGETYAIEEQGEACQRCRDAEKGKSRDLSRFRHECRASGGH
jgi:hypothetical protein